MTIPPNVNLIKPYRALLSPPALERNGWAVVVFPLLVEMAETVFQPNLHFLNLFY